MSNTAAVKRIPDHHEQHIWPLLLFLFILIPAAFASLPVSLNYQGFLTDSSGAPVDGSTVITFRIYDAQTTTTPLWFSGRTVDVRQGVFSVELGSSSNPFPQHMFDNPLWLGLSVGSDSEMSPRRAITTTAFAYRAQDADMLDGSNASAYDQSAHLMDTNNPHGITPSQIGASEGPHTIDTNAGTMCVSGQYLRGDGACVTGFLDADGVDAYNAAYDTEAEIDAAVSNNGYAGETAFTLHIADPASHHWPYSDSDAVTAMLANDGAGSTLDSDKVDGLEASELIDASQDEVRTPISSLPYTINQPGSYYITNNLDGSSGGIDITADDVALDLMEFVMDGNSANDFGIDFSSHSNVTIRNGTIKHFGRAGIFQGGADTYNNRIMDMRVTDNGVLSTGYMYSGVYTAGKDMHVDRCTVSGNNGTGISVSSHSNLNNNIVYENAAGISAGSHSTLTGNIVSDNTGAGIAAEFYTTLYRNKVYGNTTGIFFSSGSTLIGNTVANSDSTYAIQGGTESIIIANTTRNNQHWGLFVGNGNLIKDNNFISNNSSNSQNEGGLMAVSGNRIIGNNFSSNRQSGLVIVGAGNAIEDNLMTGSSYGLRFTASGNFYGNNRASSNTTDFELAGTTQTTNANLPNISF